MRKFLKLASVSALAISLALPAYAAPPSTPPGLGGGTPPGQGGGSPGATGSGTPIGNVGNTGNGNSGGGIGNTGPGNPGNGPNPGAGNAGGQTPPCNNCGGGTDNPPPKQQQSAPRHHHGSVAAMYVGSAIACSAVFLIAGSAIKASDKSKRGLQKELTLQEAHATVAGCFLPFIGAILVNETWKRHPEWAKYNNPAYLYTIYPRANATAFTAIY